MPLTCHGYTPNILSKYHIPIIAYKPSITFYLIIVVYTTGIVPTVAKSVVATAVTFAAYEGMKDFLAWNRLQNSIVECSKRPPSKP